MDGEADWCTEAVYGRSESGEKAVAAETAGIIYVDVITNNIHESL